MKPRIHYALILLAGLGAGAMAGERPWADGKQPSYYVAQLELTGDAIALAHEYVAQIGWTLPAFGGRILLDGANGIQVEGDRPRLRNVVIRFDSLDQAQAWYHSPYHQMLIPIRQEYATALAWIVEEAPQ